MNPMCNLIVRYLKFRVEVRSRSTVGEALQRSSLEELFVSPKKLTKTKSRATNPIVCHRYATNNVAKTQMVFQRFRVPRC